VILDEPFRGLDRDKRRELLGRARRYWHDATLLCISHDIAAMADLDRVLVIDEGRLVEDGAAASLAADPASRFRALLDAEAALRDGLWSSPLWRRLRMMRGHLTEACSAGGNGDAASLVLAEGRDPPKGESGWHS
jgi:ATP-binding cassette subfamily B protein